MTLEEIDVRRKEIAEIITRDDEGTDLDALQVEIEALEAEQRSIKERVAKRKALQDFAEANPSTLKVVGEAKQFEERKQMNQFEMLASPEYRSAFLRNLMGLEISPEERASVTATAAIPTQTLNKIVEKLEQFSVLYRHITVMNIPSNVTIPAENATADASWIGMSSASTDSADSITSISLSAYKLIKTVTLDANVEHMSIDAFENYIVDKLAKKMARAVENAILNGVDTTQPKGIMAETYSTASNLVTLTSVEDINWGKTMDLVALLPTEYAQNAKFVMNRKTLYTGFGKVLASTAGTPLFLANGNDGFAGKIVGYDVIVDDLLADDEVLLGDPSAYHWNWAKPIEIAKDDSVGFRTGSTTYRALALADGELVDKAAFVRMNKATA